MDEGPKNVQREVVPRWRQIARTRPEETASSAKPDVAWLRQLLAGQEEAVTKAYARWTSSPDIENASELVAVALMTSFEQLAIGAANQILAPNSQATAATKEIARRLKTGKSFEGVSVDAAPPDPNQQLVVARKKLASIKRQLADYPRNALLCVEASRLYSTLGQRAKAVHMMELATALAPSNRFVLRSASRLFVHEEDPRRGHDLLRRSEETPHDPWLLAAELALGSISNRTSKFVGIARDILRANHLTDRQKSELAAALGTLEMHNGADKVAKKLFRQSLVDPTDNSIAQVRWAARRIGMKFDENLLVIPGTFEARTEAAYVGDAHPREIIEHALEWWHDEPFSGRPMILASFIAATKLHDQDLALKLAEGGLVANKDDPTLINNRIVALAKLGRLSEADEELRKLLASYGDSEPLLNATAGLLHFRAGRLDAGRQSYARAITGAREVARKSLEVRAELHLIEEEMVVGNFDVISRMKTLKREVEKSRDVTLANFWRGFIPHLKAIALNAGVGERIPTEMGVLQRK